MSVWAEQWARLPDLLSAHLLLSGSALIVGALISLPLGVACAKSDRLRGPALSLASIIQTIPALALLALMVPLLGRIGYWPAFIALTLYSILPILRNTVVGIAGLDTASIEAARAVGMTRRQRLWRVELPLAAPTIIAGVRTATVWVVGAATLSTPVGAPSLGDFIFSGLQTRTWEAVLMGCAGSAGLAIILDQLLRQAEIGVASRQSRRGFIALGLTVSLMVLAVLPALWPEEQRASARIQGSNQPPSSLQDQRIVIGAKAFTEQYILAELIGLRLQDAGARPVIRTNLGSTVAFDALADSEIDIYVDYTGTLWANILKQAAPVARDEMAIRTGAYLLENHEILQLGRLGFENAYGLAVTTQTARQIGDSISGLANAAPLEIGGDAEFFARSEWIRARDLYNLQAATTRSMDSTFLYDAVRDGQVTAITAYTTDGRIAAFDLVILDDALQAFPPYDAVLLISPQMSSNNALTQALRALLNSISPDQMREANRRVDIDRQTPASAAAWLNDQINGSE